MYHSSPEVIYVSVYLTYEYRLSVTADLLVTLEVLDSRALLRTTAKNKAAQALGSRTGSTVQECMDRAE